MRIINFTIILFTSNHKQLFYLKKNQLKLTKLDTWQVQSLKKCQKLIPKIMFKGICMFCTNGGKNYLILLIVK